MFYCPERKRYFTFDEWENKHSGAFFRSVCFLEKQPRIYISNSTNSHEWENEHSGRVPTCPGISLTFVKSPGKVLEFSKVSTSCFFANIYLFLSRFNTTGNSVNYFYFWKKQSI